MKESRFKIRWIEVIKLGLWISVRGSSPCGDTIAGDFDDIERCGAG
jgi:hypothetical protein